MSPLPRASHPLDAPSQVVQSVPHWQSAVSPATAPKRRRYSGAGVFVLVVLAHVGLLILAATQTLRIASSDQGKASNGPLRVNLVSTKLEQAAPQTVVQAPPPPQPRPEKKILASDAPSSRVVEAPKPRPDPTPVAQTVAQTAAPQQPAVLPSASAQATAPNVATTASKPNSQDPGVPREVGQVDCRVPKPEYPRSARRRGEAGTTSVRLTLDERAQVSAVIDHSSGFPDLDATALQAALAAQCKPYVEAGRPVRVTALQPFNFVPSD